MIRFVFLKHSSAVLWRRDGQKLYVGRLVKRLSQKSKVVALT